MNKMVVGAILIILLVVGILAFQAILILRGTQTTDPGDGLLRICPDQKILNRMPRTVSEAEVGEQLPRDYYILDGGRRELSEFDVDWVEENCDVEELEVV